MTQVNYKYNVSWIFGNWMSSVKNVNGKYKYRDAFVTAHCGRGN